MNYKNILNVADVLDCDFSETSLARALILKEVHPVILEEYHTLVHVQGPGGVGWVLPTSTNVESVYRRVTRLVSKGEMLVVPPSLLDKRCIPLPHDFTFIGETSYMEGQAHSPHYSQFSKDPDNFRIIPLYSEGYDPDSLHIMLMEWFKDDLLLSEYDKHAVEHLIGKRPWFADYVGLKGLILQERVPMESADIWEPRGLIITAQLSKRRWGVLYRFGEDTQTYLTTCAANTYFAPEFDDGCSKGDSALHFFKAGLTKTMVPLYQATGKLSQS